jgi:hypothetical protein
MGAPRALGDGPPALYDEGLQHFEPPTAAHFTRKRCKS